jgi:hypothetical protein
MQKAALLRKWLAGGIILLFIGTAIIPSSGEKIEKQSLLFNSSDLKPHSLPSNGRWMKTFGGTNADFGYSVQQTTDGGYVITGDTGSYGAGAYDVWLIRTDSDGNEIWNKTFGGTKTDWGSSVQQTSDGGYVVTGATGSSGAGGDDVWFIKTGSDGTLVWNRTFGGINNDSGFSAQQTTDGGYIITGYTEVYSGPGTGDVWLIKTDSDGAMVWNRTFGGVDADVGYSVHQTTDGGYVMTGYTGLYSGPGGGGDVWLIKTDSDGAMVWNRTFGGTDADVGYSVQQTTDGGYIITGYTELFSHPGNGGVWLIKTSSDGAMVWNRTFGGLNVGFGNSVQQTSDGGYIIVGLVWPFGLGYTDVWLIKTNSNGNKIWDRKLGGTDEEMGWSVQQTTDGGYIIAGYTFSFGAGDADVLLVKTDSLGRSRSKAMNDPFISYQQNYHNRFPILQKLLERAGQQKRSSMEIKQPFQCLP